MHPFESIVCANDATMNVNKISSFLENKHDRLLSQVINIDDNRVSVHSEIIDACDTACNCLFKVITTRSFNTKKFKHCECLPSKFRSIYRYKLCFHI